MGQHIHPPAARPPARARTWTLAAVAFLGALALPATARAATVALWHMDETSGTTMVDSAGNHDGALTNVKVGLPGRIGKAYGFNGTSSVVRVPADPALDPGNATLKVAVSVKTTSLPKTGDFDIIRKGAHGTGPGYKVEIQRTGQASCGFGGTSGTGEIIAGPSVSDGSWHTLQCVKSSSAIKLIVDGAVFSRSVKVGSISSTFPVILGATPGNDFYKGSEDEAKITIG
jgi:Concanavalin A-like lectin/glucanases superfamily